MTRLRRVAPAPAALALGLALTAVAPLLLGGCSVNPATGDEQFTAFLSPEEERKVGAQEHPKLVAAFGGLYDDPALQRYVSSLGRLLQQTRSSPNRRSPSSSSIARWSMPSPCLAATSHVTRGLMALANDEAELAGVIAHEIGHVTARHSAEPLQPRPRCRPRCAILGAVIDNRSVSDFANLAAGAYVQGYSRTQELEADTLGVRYLSRAGFDATAMSSFLETMGPRPRWHARLPGSAAMERRGDSSRATRAPPSGCGRRPAPRKPGSGASAPATSTSGASTA